MTQPNVSEKQLSIRGVLGSVRRRKWFLALPLVLLPAAAAYYAIRQPDRFRAKAMIASNPASAPGFLSGRRAPEPVVDVQEQLRSIRDTVLSPAVLEEVIREFKLYDLSNQAKRKAALEDMKSRILIQVDSPQAFYIGFEGPSARQVMLVTNRLAELFIERRSDMLGQREAKVDDFLDVEVKGLRQQLRAEEQALAGFRQSVGQELPERLADNLRQVETLQEQVQRKTDQMGDLQARRAAAVAEMKMLEGEGALRKAPKTKTPAETQLEEMRMRLKQLRARYTADYPGITELQQQIRTMEATQPAAAESAAGQPTEPQMRYFTLQAELKSIDERLKSSAQEREVLSAQMTSLERRIGATPGYEGRLAQRTRDLAITRTRYEEMYAKQQEARLDQRAGQTATVDPLRVVEPAETPARPYSPRRERIILMGVLAALALGALGIVFAEMTDSTLRTAEEFQDFSNLPVLASIPRISDSAPPSTGRTPLELVPARSQDVAGAQAARKHFAKSRLAVVADPHSVAAEQYRILALKVQQRMAQKGGGVLAITSSAGGEGKTLTTVNLALDLSSSTRERVLLIDGDLRRPRVKDYLRISPEAGFADLLAEPGADLSRFVQRVGSLDVISGGTLPGNPAALLSLHAPALMARLREEYRWILVDCPPVVPVVDSHLLAGIADRVLMVVRARHTSRELFQRAVETLGATNLFGVVLNEMDYGDTSYAYAYRYYQQRLLSR